MGDGRRPVKAMALYAEWIEAKPEPVIVTHEGNVRLGESGDDLTPEEAERLARALNFAAGRARVQRRIDDANA